ncbi:MAG: ribosome maturation factor RimP [Gammaproteobacteria bacterium GWE2_42_36]|nr:MAG: ribosome maturation factor RimP [Gammaproteobacteria bacterium GWE2_42_36]HCU05755.1 ribosome maturation factor RimP [Coxiellaceae bacterium]
MDKRAAALTALIQPTITAMGYEFIGLDYLPQGRYALLRIYVDKAQGILVDDCSRISQQVSALLDVENPIATSYTLEVSSPGIERPLFTLDQFKRCLNEKIVVRLKAPLEGQRNFQGILVDVSDCIILLQCEDKTVTLPFDLVSKAHKAGETSSL